MAVPFPSIPTVGNGEPLVRGRRPAASGFAFQPCWLGDQLDGHWLGGQVRPVLGMPTDTGSSRSTHAGQVEPAGVERAGIDAVRSAPPRSRQALAGGGDKQVSVSDRERSLRTGMAISSHVDHATGPNVPPCFVDGPRPCP